MTTSTIAPVVTNPVAQNPQSIFDGLKDGLMTYNESLKTLDQTRGAAGTKSDQILKERTKAQDEKAGILNAFQELATKVKERINFVATRDTLDDYREIVPLVQLLDGWSQDEALAVETDTVRKLKEAADSAKTTEGQVRSKLVGDREEMAREEMGLAAVATHLSFVRVYPLLRAQKLWMEVVQIVQGIEPLPEELATNQNDLEKCNTGIRDALLELQEVELRKEATCLDRQWRVQKDSADVAAVDKTFAGFRQIVHIIAIADIQVSQEFLEAFWNWQNELIARKTLEIQLHGLLGKGHNDSLRFDERSSTLRTAMELAEIIESPSITEIDAAMRQLEEQATSEAKSLEAQFTESISKGAYEQAREALEKIMTVAASCSDVSHWTRRAREMKSDLDKATQPSEHMTALRELLEMLESALQSDTVRMYETLDSIKELRRRIPIDLEQTPDDLRGKVVDKASKLGGKLPEPDGLAQQNQRRDVDAIANGAIGLQQTKKRS